MSRKKRSGPSTIELLLRLPQQVIALIKAEYANAKGEIKRGVKKIVIALLFLIVALFFLFWSLAAFGASAILGLANAVSPWLAALIVGGGLVVLAAGAIVVGVMMIKRANPVPEETLGRVSDDVTVATTVRYNTTPDARIHEATEKGGQAAPGKGSVR